jgi:hypothetical protein
MNKIQVFVGTLDAETIGMGSVIRAHEWSVKRMRLIDADALITRLNSVLKTVNVVFPDNFDVGCLAGVKSAIQMVKDAPSVDAVPVVRCKDCSNTDIAVCLPDGMFYCNEWESTTRGHWYCCRGEEKEEVKTND